MRTLTIRIATVCAIGSALLAGRTVADEPLSGEPLYGQWQKWKQSTAASPSALLQVVGDVHADANQLVPNGFVLANFRFGLRGKLDDNVYYHLQTSFLRSPSVIDARLGVAFNPLFDVAAGAMKAPFSYEFLTGAASIDFVNRSQVVTLLVPGRQVGMQVSGRSGWWEYAIAMFNGNGLRIVNDDNNVMGVLRMGGRSDGDDHRLRCGFNVYGSDDSDAPLVVPITGNFLASGYTGTRSAFGADVRFERGEWLLASEGIWSRFDPRGGARVEPFGYQVTAGRFVHDKVQALLRWDSMRPDGVLIDSDQIVLGLNYWPTTPTEVQVNVIAPTRGNTDNYGLLVNLQMAL